MKPAPKKLANQAVAATVCYMALYEHATPRVQQRLRDKQKQTFERLVDVMDCNPSEKLMVHENLLDIARRSPRRCPVRRTH